MTPESSIQNVLFPEEPRGFTGRRILRTILRTVHILGGGVLVGAVLFEQPETTVTAWLGVAVISGVMLFATDLHATFAILFEWRGLAVLTKLALLALLGSTQGYDLLIVVAVLTVGSVSSHLSRRFRHRLWLRLDSFVVDTRRG